MARRRLEALAPHGAVGVARRAALGAQDSSGAVGAFPKDHAVRERLRKDFEVRVDGQRVRRQRA
eukprot:10856574-Alexandrium_andersonii.AAC.1